MGTSGTDGSARAWDLLLLAAVPAVLLCAFALPEATRRSLAFAYERPTLLTAYAAHFVHLRSGHLLSSLGGYLLVAPVTYLLATVTGRRVRFRVAFVATLVGLPFALSGLNLAIVRPRVGYGFSGVLAGLFGLLALELFAYLRAALRVDVPRGSAAAVFFLEVALVAVAMLPRTPQIAFGAVLGGAATVAYAGPLVDRVRRGERTWDDWVRRPGYAELGVAAGLLLLAFPALAFPRAAVGDGAVVNLYAHLLGFCLAFVAGYALPPVDASPHSSRPRGHRE